MKSGRFIKFRLSLLVFLQFFVPGITCPILSLYLMNYLGFSGAKAGIVLSVSGVTTIVSSIAGTMLANRFLSVRSLLGLSHFSAGILMLIFVTQKEFIPVLIIYLFYTFALGCTNGCVSAVIFNNEKNARKNFGGIQMWGSIGWIMAGILYSYVWMRNVSGQEAMNRLVMGLKAAGVVSLLLSLYTMTLPETKEKAEKVKRKTLLPVEAVEVLKKPGNFLMAGYEFIIFSFFQYYLFAIGPFLQQSHYKESFLVPIMSIAQVSEAVSLGVLGYFIVKKGFRKVLFFGLACNLWRFIALTVSHSFPFVLSALVCHGLASAFFYSGACVYLDNQCDNPAAKPAVQQIVSILSYGLGASFGNLVGGRMTTVYASASTGHIHYSYFWGAALAADVVMSILFIIGFIRNGCGKAK